MLLVDWFIIQSKKKKNQTKRAGSPIETLPCGWEEGPRTEQSKRENSCLPASSDLPTRGVLARPGISQNWNSVTRTSLVVTGLAETAHHIRLNDSSEWLIGRGRESYPKIADILCGRSRVQFACFGLLRHVQATRPPASLHNGAI